MPAELGIIGGYLGSGKSTLINRLLDGALPGRTAVVVNDFGSVNIDSALIASSSQDTIELTNGCICCQITDDVSRTMTALAARADLDRVLCEVSGVGDPRQLASWRAYPGFSAGPILVCADTTAIAGLLRNEYVSDTVERQLAAADVVLLTKTDLAIPPEIESARQRCSEAAPTARILLHDAADPGTAAAAAFAAATRSDAPTGGGDLPGADSPDDHAARHSSVTLEDLNGADMTVLAAALSEQADRLVRAKGVLQDPQGAWHDIQLSAGRVDRRVRSAGSSTPALVLIAAGPHAEDRLDAAAQALRAALRM